MDVFRSRSFLCSTILVVHFIILTVVIYPLYKKSFSSFEEILEDEILDEEIKTTYPQDTVDDDPFELSGYSRSTAWKKYPSHGILSAYNADFQNDKDCLRVIIFMGRGVALAHILTECDSLEPTTWLVMVNSRLYYHRRAMISHGPGANLFTVAKKLVKEKKCLVADYSVSWKNSRISVNKSEVREVKENEDDHCNSLLHFKMPRMMLLSRKGDPGKFIPGRTMATINPWEPVGVVSRVYYYGIRCFRQITVTSFGRIVDAVKMTCGPVRDFAIVENMFYYGYALMVRRNSSDDSFVIIYNPKRSGDCFKKTLYFESGNGRPSIFTKSKEDLRKGDQDCLDLVQGNIPERALSQTAANQTEARLRILDSDVEPYGANLKDYEAVNEWSFLNLFLELGIAVRHYSNKENGTLHKMILVVAKGAPLTAALVERGSLRRLVLREDVLYYNTSIMARKINANHTYTTLVKVDENTCFKELFVVKHIDGMVLKEEQRDKEGNVTKTTDEDCMDLITGRKLKHQDFTKSGAETNDDGIPKDYLI